MTTVHWVLALAWLVAGVSGRVERHDNVGLLRDVGIAVIVLSAGVLSWPWLIAFPHGLVFAGAIIDARRESKRADRQRNLLLVFASLAALSVALGAVAAGVTLEQHVEQAQIVLAGLVFIPATVALSSLGAVRRHGERIAAEGLPRLAITMIAVPVVILAVGWVRPLAPRSSS